LPEALISLSAFVLAAGCGFGCRNRVSKTLLWVYAALSLGTALGYRFFQTADLPSCNVDFIKGLTCAAPFKDSVQYRWVDALFAATLAGSGACLALTLPIGFIAAALEWRSRRK
jgi:hypothetical protein